MNDPASKSMEKEPKNPRDKKAAKKIIKLAKEHPDWYTKQDVEYAKMIKRKIKAQEKSHND